MFARSLFRVFSSTTMRHFFLSCTISFNTSKRRAVASLILLSQPIRGFPSLLCPATCPSIMSRSNDPFTLIKPAPHIRVITRNTFAEAHRMCGWALGWYCVFRSRFCSCYGCFQQEVGFSTHIKGNLYRHNTSRNRDKCPSTHTLSEYRIFAKQ